MKKEGFFSAKNVATLAILLALVIVLQAFGGSFSIGAVTLNFTLIPLVLGAIVLGPWAGAFLGFASGVIVLIQVILAPTGFYYIIWSNSPFVTTMICLVKTTVAGFVAGWIFNILEKKNRYAAIFIAAGLVPIINTVLFVLGCLCMSDTIALMAGGENVFVFILVGLVTFNFFIEFAINLLFAPGLHTVYKAVEKQFKKSR
ncbi:MAG: ECF transporter S component [Clostridia bacterium]|nr:ECF transporter S component [Clostridia bacterium]MBQ8430162.1 ECF transporter S component [Clostridia bacterium]MBQ8430265.1 ECF transporter S component [Clostridia bacterium]MBQ9117765.1 ECF transporter S component [Clostridia bacterium]